MSRAKASEHAFLQAIMQRGMMLESAAKSLYKKICNVDSEAAYFDFIASINRNISFADFALKRIIFPGDGRGYIGFVNTKADESSKKASKYRLKDGKVDIRYPAYFRALMEAIVLQELPRGETISSISSGTALNLAITLPTQNQTQEPLTQDQEIPPMRLTQRESALHSYIEDGWLALHSTDLAAYCLGPRTYLELGTTLLEEMTDIPAPIQQVIAKALGIL